MDQEVAKTLGELELKLQELERELTSIGRRDAPAHPERATSKSQAPSRLIDEAVERDGSARTDAAEANSGSDSGNDEAADDVDERAVDNAFGGPAVFGGEEIPARGGTIEGTSAFPVSETAYGEIATGSPASPFPSGVFSPAASPTPQPRPPLPPPMPGPQPPTTPPSPPSVPSGSPYPPPSPPSVPSGSPYPPPSPPSVPPTPTPQPPPPQPIDRAELVRFKEKLQRTMEDLIDEYAKLLLPKPPA